MYEPTTQCNGRTLDSLLTSDLETDQSHDE